MTKVRSPLSPFQGKKIMDVFDRLYIGFAFFLQVVLIIHFAVRKRRFDLTMRYGWIVYALSIPAAVLSVVLLLNGKSWGLWLAGFLYLGWALFGFFIEYVKLISWRNPFRKSIGIPYLLLYLITIMFYWWPLANLYKPLWYLYTFLFFATTYLNVTSHKVEKTVKVIP